MTKHTIRLPKSLLTSLMAGLFFISSPLETLWAQEKEQAAAAPRSVSEGDLKTLKALDQKYQKAQSITMDVDKTLKLGLLGSERKSKGKLHLSRGRVRMELEGDEKTLLVVNKKNLWAVTFPPAEFKDAAVQVIKGDLGNKKAKSKTDTAVGLLTQGGILKSFKPTGAQANTDGSTIYFLQPLQSQSDFKRAQIAVSKDGSMILGLRYWDDRDNETSFEFSDVKFGKKADDQLFTYTPPKNADVMAL